MGHGRPRAVPWGKLSSTLGPRDQEARTNHHTKTGGGVPYSANLRASSDGICVRCNRVDPRTVPEGAHSFQEPRMRFKLKTKVDEPGIKNQECDERERSREYLREQIRSWCPVRGGGASPWPTETLTTTARVYLAGRRDPRWSMNVDAVGGRPEEPST